MPITCTDFSPDPDRPKRCRYYTDGGTCQLQARFLCEEWEKVNRPAAPVPTTTTTPLPAVLPAGSALVGDSARGVRVEQHAAPPPPQPPTTRRYPTYETGFALTPAPPRPEAAKRHLSVVRPAEKPRAVEFPSRAELDALEAEVGEVVLQVGEQTVVLVRTKTESGRNEITFSAARCLSDAVHALGARVESIVFRDEKT